MTIDESIEALCARTDEGVANSEFDFIGISDEWTFTFVPMLRDYGFLGRTVGEAPDANVPGPLLFLDGSFRLTRKIPDDFRLDLRIIRTIVRYVS